MVLTQIGHLLGELTHSASVGYIKVQQIQRLGISCNRGIEIFQWMLNGLLRSTLRKVAVGFARGDMRGGPEGSLCPTCLYGAFSCSRPAGQGVTTVLQGGTSHPPAAGPARSPCSITSRLHEAAKQPVRGALDSSGDQCSDGRSVGRPYGF